MSNSQLIVGLVLMIVMLEMWNAHRSKSTCRYCGEYKTHAPHCPWERVENL